ncbi:RHS repeat-associated core domain-containing protein, partial [Moraxella bovoculi 237]
MTAPNTEQNLLDEKTSTGISANQEKDINTKPQKADIANATSLVSALQPNTHSQSKDQAGTNAKHNDTNPIILSLDVFGRLDTLTLPQGSTYTRQYDDFGRLITHTDANTGTHSLSHNIHHLPTLIQDENTTTAITYNELKMPTKRQTCQTQKTNTSKTEQSNQAQNCQTVSYHYDNKHRPTTIKDQHQDTTYVYDEKGNVIKTEVVLTTTTHTTAYQYDSLGRITHTHLPEGIILTHHYDKHSQTTSIDYQLPNTSVWRTLTRSLMGHKNQNPLLANIKTSSTQGLVSFTHTNNTNQVNVYDHKDRLSQKHDHNTNTKLSYSKDSNHTNPNNLSQIVSIDTNGNIINIDELTSAYTYDSNGNRTKHHNIHYTYEPNSDRLSTITTKDDKDSIVKTTHYTYDNLGNPVMITTKDHKGDIIKQRALTYTPDGQIKSIKDTTQDKQGNKIEKLIATYQYNHLRQRIAKTTYDDKGAVKDNVQYLWDKGLLSAEIKDDKVIRRYVYLDIMPVAVL